MGKSERFDLEERLIDFAVRIIRLSDSLPKTDVGHHVGKQILRSGTSPAPNYGEAQSAESRNDFVHKMKISLKELRETKIWLRIAANADLVTPTRLEPLLKENEELISIFVTSIQTAQKNNKDCTK